MPNARFCIGKPAADLNHVANESLAESANLVGVLGEDEVHVVDGHDFSRSCAA
jgi:hypothetical protein